MGQVGGLFENKVKRLSHIGRRRKRSGTRGKKGGNEDK